MTTLLLVLLTIVIIFWFEILKMREYVIKRCQRACEEAKIQFLDQSVAVISIKFRLGKNGLPELLRIYQFEYSENGVDRLPAYVDLINNRIISIRFTGPDGETIYHH